jgi:hypothetical protein
LVVGQTTVLPHLVRDQNDKCSRHLEVRVI